MIGCVIDQQKPDLKSAAWDFFSKSKGCVIQMDIIQTNSMDSVSIE